MARILPFSAADRSSQDAQPQTIRGDLVAMRHVDLDTVVKTVHFLRDIGRGHLLDSFNRPLTRPEAPEPAS